MKHGDVIRVTWDDAHSYDGWMNQHEMDSSIKSPCSRVISCGLFIAKTKKALILTQGVSEYGHYLGSLEIPLSTIVSTKILERSQVNAK